MHNNTQICVTCERDYKPETTGCYVFEWASFGLYRIWTADKKKCPECGHEILAGFGKRSMEHYEGGFEEYRKNIEENRPDLILNWGER